MERRRRETINEGINELAKIVPGCEKNKGSILQRAVQYISQLKEAETANLEKWTLEKLLLDQAINELSQTCDRLKTDYQKAWEEKEAYKRACEENDFAVEFKNQEASPAPAPWPVSGMVATEPRIATPLSPRGRPRPHDEREEQQQCRAKPSQ